MVAWATAIISGVGGIVSGGLIFEVGRRIGRASVERTNNETDVEELEELVEEQFQELDHRLSGVERVREREHRVVLEWMERITDALQAEGYDVERPEAVRPTVEMDDTDSVDD